MFSQQIVLIVIEDNALVLLITTMDWIHSNVLYGSVTLSVLMLDEAHERTMYTDIAIGLLKKVMLVYSVSVENLTVTV